MRITRSSADSPVARITRSVYTPTHPNIPASFNSNQQTPTTPLASRSTAGRKRKASPSSCSAAIPSKRVNNKRLTTTAESTPTTTTHTSNAANRATVAITSAKTTTSKKPTRKRQNPVETNWKLLKQELHVSTVPDSLPGRSDEYEEIKAHVDGGVEDKSGFCLYLSGVPGTGKTATIRHVLKSVTGGDTSTPAPRGHVHVTSLEINGMKLTDPSFAYSILWKHITGQTVSALHAQDLLNEYFGSGSTTFTSTSTNGKSKKKKSTKTVEKPMIILVLDELDLMINKKQTVIYNFLNWPTLKHSRLIVIAIANTMDLPERSLTNKITSRLGLVRMNFYPYNVDQLIEIIKSRVDRFSKFSENAIKLCARKISAVSGDARRALDICRRACEIAGPEEEVTHKHISTAITEMLQTSTILFIQRNCSFYQKFFLIALIMEIRSCGMSECDLSGVVERFLALYDVHVNKQKHDNGVQFMRPTRPMIANICSKLGDCRVVILQNSNIAAFQKIRLGLVEEDVISALKSDTAIKNFSQTIMVFNNQ